MTSEVGHVVDRGRAHPVLRITGVLAADTTADVRQALLDTLADAPEALVVDVSGLMPADGAAADVFRRVARETTVWPAAQLLLTAPDATPWQRPGLPVCPSVPAALATLSAPTPGARLELVLEPVVGAARRARELVTEACARWDLPELAGSGSIVVTELANNAVAHARTSMTVMLSRYADTIAVAVRDRSAAQPHFEGPVPPTAYGGRGLLLIDAVTRDWGSLPLSDGKVVWAILNGEESSGSSRSGLPAGMANHGRG
ncbi:ATP-binding protein [Krasilnikovia sp. MM14-A1259]|uniref:ATP-binding protein n=1 Tax=Krasilnikovia sp. MM14-A1259 TaxID=3373539 RepID=UPI0038207939